MLNYHKPSMTYVGNRIFNFNNLLVVFSILLFVAFFIFDPNYGYLLIIVFAFFITSAMAFFFELTEDELIVKNYIIPFLNIRYKLNEITQIQFLNAKAPAKAKVKIIQEYKQTLGIGYSAASLSVKDWKLFINDLIARKISVKVEPVRLQKAVGIVE